MNCHRKVAALALISVVLLAGGCSPDGKKLQQDKEGSKSEPIKESYVKMVDSGGVSRMSIQSNIDKFRIVLPHEFRGTVLTKAEIEEFAKAMSGGKEPLKSQLVAQADSLRSSGGALFAVNFRPQDVVDGFADNMNVAIRGFQEPPKIDELVSGFEKQLAGSGAVKVDRSTLQSKAGPITYLRSTTKEKGKDGKEISITRYAFLIVREGNPTQVFAVSAASSAKRQAVAEPEFKQSVMSLEFL